MSKHTPGPWVDGGGCIISAAEEFSECRRPVICDMRQWPDGNTVFIHKPNARLIAAAPELLEALRSVLSEGRFDFNKGDSVHQALQAADAAIAKATGGQS